jgi:agmatinase
MVLISSVDKLNSFFNKPENTASGVPFGNPPNMPTFDEADVVVFGVPFDDSATFGKGAERGPEALRVTSSKQIETFVADLSLEFYDKVRVFDFGDLNVPIRLDSSELSNLYEAGTKKSDAAREKLQQVMNQFAVIKEAVKFIRAKGKIPLMMGGEHTLTYWALMGVAEENPVVLHFDAHRDAKREYLGVPMCHTTPMYHAINDGPLKDFVQIGIRQTDRQEQDFAIKSGVKTFYPQDIKKDIKSVANWIKEKTKNRKIYVTFDIDVLDIPYVPCTGTPEPFGLTPEEVIEIFNSIEGELIGVDMMEVAVRGDDFREGTTAVQMLLRLLARGSYG